MTAVFSRQGVIYPSIVAFLLTHSQMIVSVFLHCEVISMECIVDIFFLSLVFVPFYRGGILSNFMYVMYKSCNGVHKLYVASNLSYM